MVEHAARAGPFSRGHRLWHGIYTFFLLLLLAMAATTITVFSYRVDACGWFRKYSNYTYHPAHLEGGWVTVFWIHKSCMHIWTMLALVHIWYTVVFQKFMGPGKPLRYVHMTVGTIITLDIPIGAFFGLLLLSHNQERYAAFTSVALSITAVAVLMFYTTFLLAKFTSFGDKVHHGFVGMVFNIIPFAFILQFWIYSLGLRAPGRSDFAVWVTSMVLCGVVAAAGAILFLLVLIYQGSRNPDGHRFGQPGQGGGSLTGLVSASAANVWACMCRKPSEHHRLPDTQQAPLEEQAATPARSRATSVTGV